MLNKLKKDLGEKRYEHSLRVRDTAVDLAKIHNIDLKKAELAGLLHDCAKYEDKDRILEEADFYKVDLDPIFKLNPGLIHSYLGAYVAKNDYGIEDEDILNAIKYHTIGRKNMSDLEKLIYMADLIEPMRNYPKVDLIREKSKKNLDEALYFAMNENLKFVASKDILIHPNTIEARNTLLIKIKNLWYYNI